MKKAFLTILLLIAPLSLRAEWKRLESGLEHRQSEGVHFLRLDPKKFHIDLALASDFAVPTLSAEDFRRKSGAMLAINGGFFDESYRSLGLLHRGGRTLNSLRNAGWGVFLVRAREPRIIVRQDWKDFKKEEVTMALQVGPRLIVDGEIPHFKEGPPSRRSAIGITPRGWVVIALSERPMTLVEWAQTLRRECRQALNLDGGGSSQLSVAHPRLSVKIDGLTNVPNAVAVFRK